MKMNESQRKVLIVVGALVFAMLIFPPYVIYYGGANSGIVFKSGYAFILDLPNRATMNIGTLLVQWVGTIIAGGIAFFFLNEK